MSQTGEPFPRILVIDDNQAIHDDFRKILCPERCGKLDEMEKNLFGAPANFPDHPVFEMESAFQGEEGLARVQSALKGGKPYSVAFIDVRMPPGWDGIETAARLWEAAPDLQVVLCTAYSDYSWSEMTSRLKYSDRLVVLKKPFDTVEVLQLAAALTAKWRLMQEAKSRMDQLETLVRARTSVLRETNENLRTEILRRQQTAEALTETEERYHLLFQKNPLPMWVIDLKTLAFLAVNNAAIQKYGYSAAEFASMTVRDLHPPEDSEILSERFSDANCRVPTNGLIVKHLLKDGSVIFAEIISRVVSFSGREAKLALANDVTEKKKLEAQFLRAQRIESIGTLATGMAHDLNNILAPILMSAGFLRWNLGEEEREKAIARIELSVKRGAEIIQQVLTFGRGIDGDRVAVNPASVVDEIGRIIGQTFPKNIHVEINTEPGLWSIVGDPTQIHQVLLNLSVNARDAMLKGGSLSLRSRNVILAEPMPALPTPAPPGRYVVFEVADSGCGIPAADRERIFDPFFTTKEVGKGTGLGLSTALGIVKSHRGVVIVDSEPGCGTTFRVFFPASSTTADKVTSKIKALQPLGCGESILLVDDEPDVLAGMAALLERNNYRVLTARNGEEALARVASHDGPLDAVITDIMMPEMDGVTLIRHLHEARPGLRIIASSGHGTDMNGSLRSEELKLLGVSFLAKPYTSDKLLAAVNHLLNGAPDTIRLPMVV